MSSKLALLVDRQRPVEPIGRLTLPLPAHCPSGALYATNTAAHSPLGMEGWRFVFLSVAVVRYCKGWWCALLICACKQDCSIASRGPAALPQQHS